MLEGLLDESHSPSSRTFTITVNRDLNGAYRLSLWCIQILSMVHWDKLNGA
ncbi:MAG: hypothetical protein LKF56_06290 [Prevotella sp.]|nr:hypothetical protein [Prevotella sp.]MCH4186434.1 hypothetical protein [Prevotella sp.]MCH4216399.1 hypothetical protein [Prevotella sp.]MCH4251227.1 hypothetical protein [Prevotella sp.]